LNAAIYLMAASLVKHRLDSSLCHAWKRLCYIR